MRTQSNAVEHALCQTITDAQTAGHLTAIDAGAAAFAIGLAAAFDAAVTSGDAHQVAPIARELRHLLERLRLDPMSRPADAPDADWTLLLRDLAADERSAS